MEEKIEDLDLTSPDTTTRTHEVVHTVSKDGGEKHNRKVTISNSSKSPEEAKSMARAHLEKQGYTIHEAAKPSEEEKPPFDGPYTKTPSAKPGKYGSGYSTARHLARQAMQKQSEKYKKPVKESLEESRKAEIVKELVKKKKAKSEDAFQPEPELSSTLTKV